MAVSSSSVSTTLQQQRRGCSSKPWRRSWRARLGMRWYLFVPVNPRLVCSHLWCVEPVESRNPWTNVTTGLGHGARRTHKKHNDVLQLEPLSRALLPLSLRVQRPNCCTIRAHDDAAASTRADTRARPLHIFAPPQSARAATVYTPAWLREPAPCARCLRLFRPPTAAPSAALVPAAAAAAPPLLTARRRRRPPCRQSSPKTCPRAP